MTEKNIWPKLVDETFTSFWICTKYVDETFTSFWMCVPYLYPFSLLLIIWKSWSTQNEGKTHTIIQLHSGREIQLWGWNLTGFVLSIPTGMFYLRFCADSCKKVSYWNVRSNHRINGLSAQKQNSLCKTKLSNNTYIWYLRETLYEQKERDLKRWGCVGEGGGGLYVRLETVRCVPWFYHHVSK